MKALTISILLVLLATQISHAQKTYSLENLEKATTEELNVYMNKALKLQKTGRVFNIIGGVSYGAVGTAAILGGPLGVDSWALIAIAGGGIIVGTTSFAIGIPTNLTGKKRVERIKTIKGTTFNNFNIDITPCVHYNLAAQNYQPGIILNIRF